LMKMAPAASNLRVRKGTFRTSRRVKHLTFAFFFAGRTKEGH